MELTLDSLGDCHYADVKKTGKNLLLYFYLGKLTNGDLENTIANTRRNSLEGIYC